MSEEETQRIQRASARTSQRSQNLSDSANISTSSPFTSFHLDIGEDSPSFTQPEIESSRAGTPSPRDTIAEPLEPVKIKAVVMQGIASPTQSSEHLRVGPAQEFSLERVSATTGDLPLRTNTSMQRDGPAKEDNSTYLVLQDPPISTYLTSINTVPTSSTTTTTSTSPGRVVVTSLRTPGRVVVTSLRTPGPDVVTSLRTPAINSTPAPTFNSTPTSPSATLSYVDPMHGRVPFTHELWDRKAEQDAYPFIKSEHAASFLPGMTARAILAHFPTLRSFLKHIEARYVGPGLITSGEFRLYLDGYDSPEGKEDIWKSITSAYTDKYNRHRDKVLLQLERAREQAILEQRQQRLSVERRDREKTEAIHRACLLMAAAALPDMSDDSSDESSPPHLAPSSAPSPHQTVDHYSTPQPQRPKLRKQRAQQQQRCASVTHTSSLSSTSLTSPNITYKNDVDDNSNDVDHTSNDVGDTSNDVDDNTNSEVDDDKATIAKLRAQLAALELSPAVSAGTRRSVGVTLTLPQETTTSPEHYDDATIPHHHRHTDVPHYTSLPNSPTPSTYRAVLRYVNPTNKLDTFLYRDCDWYSAHAMDHVPPDERFRCLFGGPDISPCTQEHLPTLDPKVFRPRGGELLCKNNESLQLTAARAIHGATKPEPCDGDGCFVTHLNLFITWLSRSGHDLKNYLPELRMSLVSQRLTVRLESVLNNSKYKAYCALAGEDHLSYNVSFYRWMECLVSHFVSKDVRGTATLLLLDKLRVSVEGDHYDIITAWLEVLRLVRLLPSYNAHLPAFEGMVVEMFDSVLSKTSPALLEDWMTMIREADQLASLMMTKNRNPYSSYAATIEHLTATDTHLMMTTVTAASRAQASLATKRDSASATWVSHY